jgi:uncharacterized repeat protein (TIGR02543 family)
MWRKNWTFGIKIFAAGLAAAIFALASLSLAPASWALDEWDGTAASSFAGGGGTETDPYIIETGEQLAYLAQILNAGGYDTTGVYFKLNDDIDLKGSVHNWTPIGYDDDSYHHRELFKGYFNGNGHVISNMTVNKDDDYAGLFGCTDDPALIEHLALANVNVTGKDYVGALVGCNWGDILNCVANGQVAGNDYVGGLVGSGRHGTVSNSMSSCSVTGHDYVGGLAGDAHRNTVISNSTSDGRVTGNRYIGGLIGETYSSSTTLSNSMAAGKIQGQSYVGLLVGNNDGTITSTVYDMQGTGYSAETTLYSKATWELTTGKAVAGLGGSWTYKSGYYPRPKTLEMEPRDGIREAAAFAATPIFLNESDSTADVKHSFSVPTKTADDTPITWTATPSDMAEIDGDTGAVTLKYIGSLTLRARSGPHTKTYALTVNDVRGSVAYRTVTFNSDGGNYTPAAQSVGVGGKVDEPTPPTKDGHAFAGWYWEDEMWNFTKDTVTENMTLVAVWTNQNRPTYTVTFDSQGGSDVRSQTVPSGKITKPSNPTFSGYIFVGWYKDEGLQESWNFSYDVVDRDITLYAKWKLDDGTGDIGDIEEALGGGCDSFGLGLGILALAAGVLSVKGGKKSGKDR